MDSGKYPFLWKFLLYIVALVALAAASLTQRNEALFAWDLTNVFTLDFPEALMPKDLSPKEKLLFGNSSAVYDKDYENAEALYLSEPENPAYFSEYAQRFSSSFDKLPPGYLETVARIDPQNALYLYLAAGQMDYDAIERLPRSGAAPTPRFMKGVRLSPLPVERDYRVNDQAAYENSLKLIEEASKLNRFQTYSTTMMRERMRCLRQTDTIVTRAVATLLTFGQTSTVISIRKVADVLSARAQELSKDGNMEGFLELVSMREHFVDGLLANPDVTIINQMVNKIVVAGTSLTFFHAAERLGLHDLAERFDVEVQGLQAIRDSKDMRSSSEQEWVLEKSGLLSGLSLPLLMYQVNSPPLVTPAEFAPQRYADHALAMRLGLTAVGLCLFVFALPVFLFRFAFPASLRKTAGRLVQLLRPVDWVWAILLGVILPLTVILLLNRFTELGGREWSLAHFMFLFPSVHLVAVLLWVSLAPAAIIRWRLFRRIRALGIAGIPALTAAPALLGITILALAAYPVANEFGLQRLVIMALAAPVAFWISVVLGNALHGLIGKAQHRISLVATSMAILPCLSFAIIAVLLLLPAYKASEIHWLAQDELNAIRPDAPDLGMYEFRVAAEMQRELREALGRDQ